MEDKFLKLREYKETCSATRKVLIESNDDKHSKIIEKINFMTILFMSKHSLTFLEEMEMDWLLDYKIFILQVERCYL